MIIAVAPPRPLPAFLAAAARLLSRRHEGAEAADANVAAATTLWRDRHFLALASCFALVVSTLSVSESLLGTALVEAGHAPSFSASVYAVMGGVGIVSRLVIGALTLRWEVDVMALMQISNVACGLAIMGLAAHSRSAVYCYVYAAIIGSLGGLAYSMSTPVLLEVFGLERLPAAIGAAFTFRAPAVLVANKTRRSDG
jgi:cyanate permease